MQASTAHIFLPYGIRHHCLSARARTPVSTYGCHHTQALFSRSCRPQVFRSPYQMSGENLFPQSKEKNLLQPLPALSRSQIPALSFPPSPPTVQSRIPPLPLRKKSLLCTEVLLSGHTLLLLPEEQDHTAPLPLPPDLPQHHSFLCAESGLPFPVSSKASRILMFQTAVCF